jgi:hypothetical protein
VRAALTVAAALAGATSLSGCSTLGGGSTFTGDGLQKFLTDPACAHHDSIEFATTAGGMPAYLKGSASRDCPGPAPKP